MKLSATKRPFNVCPKLRGTKLENVWQRLNMARDDWFRNEDWNPAIEDAFFAKLRRARDKSQYLRIQACTLARKEPLVALRLLDEYFTQANQFDRAQAFVDSASAYLTLGEADKAIASYESALAHEEQRPSVKTNAYLDLPFLIATQGLVARYEQALALLDSHKSRLTFPVDVFRWHAAYALVASQVGLPVVASEHAKLALDAASRDQSGFRYHPAVGLVADRYDQVRHQLSALSVD
jgi:tetratricopeptide (TPR) repeat protein